MFRQSSPEMKRSFACLLVLALFAGLFLHSLAAQPTPGSFLPPGKRSEQGKVGNFEAMILTDLDQSGKTINPSTVRGREIELPVEFINPTVDSDGHCGVLLDYVVHRPDGTLYGGCRNLNGWVYLKTAPRDEFIASECYPVITFEAEDPLGIYIVEITVKDIPGKAQLPLTTHIELKDKE